MRLYDNEGYREEFMALVYDLLHSDGTNDRANKIIDAFDMAPTVEADPLFPNAPLTLKELREMDGEPVWVEHYNGGEWVIVSWNIYDEIAYTQKARLSSYNYGLSDSPGWIAYRRKPEEGTM